MKIIFKARKLIAPALTLGSSLILTVACGDDDNPSPTKPPTVTDRDAGDESTDTNATDTSADTDIDTSASNTGGSESSAADAGTGEDTEAVTLVDAGDDTQVTSDDDAGTNTETPVEGCVENEDACFSCPTTPEQFLKQCTEAQCSPFDNRARLGRYQPGEPLPAP